MMCENTRGTINQHHSVTTMFDDKGQIVQWYIDICLANGVSENLVLRRRMKMEGLF